MSQLRSLNELLKIISMNEEDNDPKKESTSDDFRKTLDEFRIKRGKIFLNKPITLNNGVTLSIQGASGSYCKPRIDSDTNLTYTEMEVGFPAQGKNKSVNIRMFKPWASSKTSASTSASGMRPANIVDIYGWVPVRIIQKFIDSCGGINLEKSRNSS